MVLTRTFKKTIQARAQKDACFRRALLMEAINELLQGDLPAGKALLRDYINATIGFDELGDILDKPSKSLHRMLGKAGNPTAENIFNIIKVLQDKEKLELRVRQVSKSSRAA